MKIFITGASGLVGGACAHLASQQGNHVTGTVGGFAGTVAGLTEKIPIDLGDAPAVTEAVLAARPDAIINAAAISEPAKCETEPARSHLLNVELPHLLARLARQTGARFLHLSSEQAFAGDRAPYAVSDPVAPINLYGRQKVESEQLVHATAPTLAVTLRAPLLMGNSPGGKRSLHERLFADWAAGRTPRQYTDEFRQTCTAENLAAALVELCARREISGIYHWAGAELLSRYEQAVRVRAHFRLSEKDAPIVAITRADDPAVAAKRQANLGLDVSALASKLSTPVETFAAQLAQLRVPASLQTWYEAHRR